MNENNTGVIPEILGKTVEYAEERGWAFILGMDSKCHSFLFGHKTNKRGEKLEDFIATHNLTIENIGQEPTNQAGEN